MALFIKGVYNPINNYAKLIVLGRLSDEVVSGLGAFGDFSLNKLMIMLTGEEKSSNVLIEDFYQLIRSKRRVEAKLEQLENNKN
jgi:hypothetical protein